MIHVKNHKQHHIFDPWGYLGPKRRKILDESWAGLFRNDILPILPVDTLRQYYHDWNGRPTKELYSMIGLMILQQTHDLTDEQAIEQFCFNIKWHYALDITNPEDTASYVSEKTLWSMRDKLSTDGSYLEIFDSTLQALAALYRPNLSKQRMDSVHIRSNMRHLGRIGIFVKTISKFLRNLKRQQRVLFDQLDVALTSRYLSKKEASLFAMVKPSESGRTLDQLAEDVFLLVQRFATVDRVGEMSSYKLLTRLFNEQCAVQEDTATAGKKAVARPNRDVPSDSLQNPSDPDAGYSGHKGKGYQAQVVESYTGKPGQLSLLTHVRVESADRHDANALLPALDDLQQRGMKPEELLADSLYGSDDNCEQGLEEYGTEVIAPVMPGNRQKMDLAHFTIDQQGRISGCPHGQAPDNMRHKKDSFSAAFAKVTCSTCPALDHCPVRRGKKAYYYRYKMKDVRLARRRQQERTPAFCEKYRFRAGVEATMSEFDRRTGVKQLRVRGMKAVAFAVIMKAVGLNIMRAARYRRGKIGLPLSLMHSILAVLAVYGLVKERLTWQTQEFTGILLRGRPNIMRCM